MLAHIARRLLQGLIVMLAVGLVSFSLVSFVGDPVASLLGLDTPQEAREQLKEELGLNDPFPVRYGRFLLRAAQGDFGLSYTSSRPVGEVIAERLPATVELTFVSAVIAIALAIPMGVYTALNRHSWAARALLVASLVGVSLPTFVIGIMLILVFSVTLGWLPSFGRGELVQIGWWSTGACVGQRVEVDPHARRVARGRADDVHDAARASGDARRCCGRITSALPGRGASRTGPFTSATHSGTPSCRW